MRFRALLSAAAMAALAACGPGDGTDEATAEPFDSAAATSAPADVEKVDRAGAIDAVNRRLEQAHRDAAARRADANEQLRQAGGAATDSL
ncbi:MAG TPA: hypothetical protein VNP72_08645 [Longimicrobium sp.]|nr:hypothetical protein [Longimicrobium sp.]